MVPYGPSGLGGQARFEGVNLAVVKDAFLPDVCLKCGTRDGVTKQSKKFQWTPIWARFLLFCTIFGLIAIAITTKRATLNVPLCMRCAGRWTAARTVTIISVVALVLSIFSFRIADDPTPGLGIFAVVLVGFVVAMYAFVRPRMLLVSKIDDREIWFKNYDRTGAEAAVRGG